jgi:hypothetical protein
VKFKIEEWGGDKERVKTYLVRGVDTHHYNDAIAGTIPKE